MGGCGVGFDGVECVGLVMWSGVFSEGSGLRCRAERVLRWRGERWMLSRGRFVMISLAAGVVVLCLLLEKGAMGVGSEMLELVR